MQLAILEQINQLADERRRLWRDGRGKCGDTLRALDCALASLWQQRRIELATEAWRLPNGKLKPVAAVSVDVGASFAERQSGYTLDIVDELSMRIDGPMVADLWHESKQLRKELATLRKALANERADLEHRPRIFVPENVPVIVPLAIPLRDLHQLQAARKAPAARTPAKPRQRPLDTFPIL